MLSWKLKSSCHDPQRKENPDPGRNRRLKNQKMKPFEEIYKQASAKEFPLCEYDIERSDQFAKNLPYVERVLYAIILTNLRGFIAGYGNIRNHVGFTKKEARAAIKTLLGQGIIEHRSCGDDDYRVSGSGFCYLNW